MPALNIALTDEQHESIRELAEEAQATLEALLHRLPQPVLSTGKERAVSLKLQ